MMRFLLSFLLFAGATTATAHEANTSLTDITLNKERLRLRIILGERSLVQGFPQLDTNDDGVLWRPEILASMDQLYSHIGDHLQTSIDGQPLALERKAGSYRIDNDGDPVLDLIFEAPVSGQPQELEFATDFFFVFAENHKNFIKLLAPGRPIEQTVFSRQHHRQRFKLREDVSLVHQIVEFIGLGTEHIFHGYDHIMFLMALIVVGGRLINLIKIVTAFTIAHSITLILAALEVVALPDRWIEAGIALSIAYVALENFWLHKSDHRWILTFTFGLIHGFGFANVLRDLGLPTQGLEASLLAFNIGVELGQVAIVAIAFPLILWLGRQTYQRQVVLGISALIFLFGLGWFIERVFGLSYMPI